MTEQDWNICTDPQPMLEFLRGKASDRKLRLFACACCRHIWALLPTRSQKAVKISEQYADGLVGMNEFSDAYDWASLAADHADGEEEPEIAGAAADAALGTVEEDIFHGAGRTATHAADAVRNPSSTKAREPWQAARAAGTAEAFEIALQAAEAVANTAAEERWNLERKCQTTILRDLLAPFRSVTIASNWLTPTVLSLTQAIYDERAFDRMPILADALEEAGCSDRLILEHCRSGGEHVRGCWVVDLVLGKE